MKEDNKINMNEVVNVDENNIDELEVKIFEAEFENVESNINIGLGPVGQCSECC